MYRVRCVFFVTFSRMPEKPAETGFPMIRGIGCTFAFGWFPRYNQAMRKDASDRQYISDVAPDSPAAEAGIERGDVLLTINGEPVRDIVDYTYLTSNRVCILQIEDHRTGMPAETRIEKEEWEPLGLSFATGIMSPMRVCRNHCLFCFIDQMAPEGRSSLHVKDDDWRMSFIMGNYVTLTNEDDREIDRIIRRRVSPLYISLHATDPEVRVKMMANPRAGEILPLLKRLKDGGLFYHLQIVLCPGINDGEVLERTIRDVRSLVPAARSMAIVPVGLTKYRKGLYPLRCFTPEEARSLIERISRIQEECLAEYGTRLVYLSDEWYCLAGQALPDAETYEGYDQIENGVGMLRLFEEEMLAELEGREPLPEPGMFDMAGGVSAVKFFEPVYRKLEAYGIRIRTHAVRNRYFGEQITVSGLITAGDLVEALRGKLSSGTLLIPASMLREQDDVFLDNQTVADVERQLQCRVIPVRDGAALIRILWSDPVREQQAPAEPGTEGIV